LAPLRWRWPSLLAVATRKLLRPPRLPTLLPLLLLLLLLLLTLPLRLPTLLLLLLAPRRLLRRKRRSSNRNAQAFSIRTGSDRQLTLVGPPRFFIFRGPACRSRPA
jgi:hypothetical protein